ncbi:MAG: NAD(P)H-binding protein [Bacteroidetes bacterium]|nr:NAD(P)H-binding protein [Bacteroidota bacterium]
MSRILITTANGMFGKAVANELINKGHPVRLMVRDLSKCTISDTNAEIVQGDLDKPETIIPVMEDVGSVFLSSPMDTRITQREISVIQAASQKGVRHIVKLYSAVKHEGDALDKSHLAVIDFLRTSGLQWTLVSPNSVMETSLFGHQPSIKYMNAIYGISGLAKIGLVALRDVAEVSSVVLTTGGHHEQNYELTGSEALNLYDVADIFSEVLVRRVDYIDWSEEAFSKMLQKYDKSLTPERLELEVLCHLRAWKNGKADLVTDTVKQITGRDPVSLVQFILDNLGIFKPGMVPRLVALMIRRFS